MTIFEEEIRSQGGILRSRAARGAEQAQRAADALRECTHLVVAARGSSDHGAIFFQYLAGQASGRLVALAAPSLYEGGGHIDLSGAGVIAISQSGRSPGMADVVHQARAQGRPSVAVTNDPASPLALDADVVIELGTGPERAIASSKTLTATWHALAQVVAALVGGDLEGIDDVSDVVEAMTGWALGLELPLELQDVAGLTMVGRGVGYAVAAEIALKVREVTGVRAESYAAPDFLHGPIGADGEGTTALVVVTDETTDAVVGELVNGCREGGMGVVALRPATRAETGADHEIVLPSAHVNWVEALSMVLVGQVIALRLGLRRGRPVDISPRLHKVTLSA